MVLTSCQALGRDAASLLNMSRRCSRSPLSLMFLETLRAAAVTGDAQQKVLLGCWRRGRGGKKKIPSHPQLSHPPPASRTQDNNTAGDAERPPAACHLSHSLLPVSGETARGGLAQGWRLPFPPELRLDPRRAASQRVRQPGDCRGWENGVSTAFPPAPAPGMCWRLWGDRVHPAICLSV